MALLGALVTVGCSSAPDSEAGAETAEATELSMAEMAAADLVVYKSPTCGCCQGWVDHMEENGYKVATVDLSDPAALAAKKDEMGVPADLGSCHTARVGDYVVEGHVPAHVVRRMLEERPEIEGIAVRGMPIGSPGMEGPNPHPYDVIAYGKGGRHVYETVTPAQPSSDPR